MTPQPMQFRELCVVPGCFREKQPPHLSCSVCASLFESWKKNNPEGSFEDWSGGIGGFYITEMAPPEPIAGVAGVYLEGTLNGEPMTGMAFGETAGVFLEQEIARLKGIIKVQELQLGLCDCDHYAEENKRLRGYALMWKKLAHRLRR